MSIAAVNARQAAAAAAAKALALFVQTAEYYNGSRISDYAPYFALAARACALPKVFLRGMCLIAIALIVTVMADQTRTMMYI